jgi:fatty acid desaturase
LPVSPAMPAPGAIAHDPVDAPVGRRDPLAAYAGPVPTGVAGRLAAALLNDIRDWPLLGAWMKVIAFAGVPAAFLFAAAPFVPWWAIWTLGALHAVHVTLGLTTYFINLSHWNAHRPLLKSGFAPLEKAVRYGIGLLFGFPGRLYYNQHLGVHHPGRNTQADLISTAPYRRDSVFDFARFMVFFFAAQAWRCGFLFLRRGQTRRALIFMATEAALYSTIAASLWLSPHAGLWVLFMPFFMVRTIVMCGHWSQHGFIDPVRPLVAHHYTTTCTRTPYNQRSFNDGYHLTHHLKPSLHWSEIPAEFEATRERLVADGALVFEGLDFFQLWMLLMRRDFKAIAAHGVRAPGESSEAYEARLRRWTQPVATADSPDGLPAEVPA